MSNLHKNLKLMFHCESLKILWLGHRDPLNPMAGGAERTIYEVCKRLVGNEHSVTLLTGGWRGCKHNEDMSGFKIFRYGKNIGPHLALPVFLLKHRYDIVVNDLGHAIPWLSSSIISKNNIVFFRHLHARSLSGQVNPFFAKFITAIEKLYFILYHTAIFVTESSTSRSDLLELGIKASKIIMIPPGVDQTKFHPTNKTDFPSLVYFGGLRSYKRPDESIYLLKNIIQKFKGLRLFIIGSGPEFNNLKQLTNHLKLQDSIDFKGRLSNEDLSNIVASSWLNIHASVTEGWGYSILEASSSGTPTVAYAVPGVVDTIENDINGVTVKDGDRNALADSAIKILSNPKKWWLSSIDVAEKYSWDRTAEMWENLIQKFTKR